MLLIKTDQAIRGNPWHPSDPWSIPNSYLVIYQD